MADVGKLALYVAVAACCDSLLLWIAVLVAVALAVGCCDLV